jgi:DeoR family transcriptional regulator of aga operon/DeoR family fructose operon transcriptional repressor
MRQQERHDQLLSLLRSVGAASVGTLSRSLGVTPSTIRRDLGELANRGEIVRTYGGALLTGQPLSRLDDDRIEAKRCIARTAVRELVEDGQTIIVGSGSTALELARLLQSHHLTVITNALDVATTLVDQNGIELIVLGGLVRPRMHSMLGHLAEAAARELRADVLFMGIGAVHPDHGLMNDSVPEILTDRALRAISHQIVVLADSSKIGQVAPGLVFGLEDVDVLVTDTHAQATDIAAIESYGVRVLVAELSQNDDTERR